MKSKFKQYSKFLIMCAIRVIACSLVGILLLTLVYLIPTKNIENNIRESAINFRYDPVFMYSWCSSRLDIGTDATILLESSYDSRNIPLLSAIAENRNSMISGISTPTALFEHYTNDIPFDSYLAYSRYWHGYLIFIKPVFSIINYDMFRILNSILQIVLLVFLSFLFIKKRLTHYLIPYLISYMFLMPVTLFFCIQYSTCYYIYIISSIVLLLFGENIDDDKLYILFLYTGISLAYFDFLTYPIVTFGIPAIIHFIMTKITDLRKSFFKLCAMFFFWGFGYGSMWVCKWIFASLILGKSAFLVSFDTFMTRVGFSDSVRSSALSNNWKEFFHTPVTTIFLVYLIILLLLTTYRFIKYNIRFKDIISHILIFITMSFLPFLWYLFASNHSNEHFWFTYKALTVFVFAIMCLMVKLITEFKHSTKEDLKT